MKKTFVSALCSFAVVASLSGCASSAPPRLKSVADGNKDVVVMEESDHRTSFWHAETNVSVVAAIVEAEGQNLTAIAAASVFDSRLCPTSGRSDNEVSLAEPNTDDYGEVEIDFLQATQLGGTTHVERILPEGKYALVVCGRWNVNDSPRLWAHGGFAKLIGRVRKHLAQGETVNDMPIFLGPV